MSKIVTSVKVFAHKNGQERSFPYAAADCNGPTGARQAAMRRADIAKSDGFAVTVREYYLDGTHFDFVYPS